MRPADIRRRWVVAAAAGAGAGILAGALLAVTQSDLLLLVTTTPAAVAAVTGCVVGLTFLVAGLWSASVAGARRAALAEGQAQERATHRRFLARLDHELKNPVTAIRAAIAAEGDPARSPHLAAVDNQAQRLATLVGELRKLAELETRPLDAEDVDLAQICREAAVDVVQHRAAQGDHRPVTFAFPQAPWPLPHVSGDPDLLFLAVHNVLTNAVKYSPAGSPLELRGSDDDGWVALEIADCGMGIPEAEQATVFDELSRGSAARGIPGSGLGLALVRAVVERHGGSVALRSRQGEGTSVRLRLPAGPAVGALARAVRA